MYQSKFCIPNVISYSIISNMIDNLNSNDKNMGRIADADRQEIYLMMI